MQISKRLAQNTIEFAFVFPLLIIMTLVIYEVALFWQDVNSIYDLNAQINAQVALIQPPTTGIPLHTSCSAADRALQVLEEKDSILRTDFKYERTIQEGTTENEPFVLYKYASTVKAKNSEPMVRLWVDCRNPYEDGITTQIEFYHKTVVIQASIPSFTEADPIVIIPSDIFIASPKLSTIRHY